MSEKKMIKPFPGMKIYEDVSFYPGVYNFFHQDGITICADDITIQGNGCVIIGGKEKEESRHDAHTAEFSYGYGAMLDEGLPYHGTGICMDNVHRVKLCDLQVRGFVQGLYMRECTGCVIEHNDFSYNYHNPDWGWEEHRDAGGIVLQNAHFNRLHQNRAVDVWSALVLRHSDYNVICNNEFSHTSNVGLRFWTASYNLFEDNDFSWGIRKAANEVHARDSSCVLMESASNYNCFRRNDMRYGGDGLFIRSLNNCMSMYNTFEENDASFANNNAIEAWDAHNTYIRNKANYSSYGFWLGCSDHTVLIGNEVMGNGVIFQNAPESFGNAGIAVVNGSGNDFYLKDNLIRDNNGPGIAIRNTKKIPSRNWILETNTIVDNHHDPRGFSGYGIYLKNAMNIHLINNTIHNDGTAVYRDEAVTMVYEHAPDTVTDAIRMIKNCVFTKVGASAVYEADGFEEYSCYFDDGFMSRQPCFERTFSRPGRYRMLLNAKGNGRIGLLAENIYVRDDGTLCEEWLQPAAWLIKHRQQTVRTIPGGIELCAGPSTSSRFLCQISLHPLQDYEVFAFFYCYQNDFIDWKQEVRLHITFWDTAGGYLKVTSREALYQKHAQQANEAKYEWEYVTIPFYEHEDFCLEYSDEFNGEIQAVQLSFETPQPANICFRMREAVWKKERTPRYHQLLNGRAHQENDMERRIHFSTASNGQYEIFKGNQFQYDISKRWISGCDTTEESITIDASAALPVDGVDIAFYADEVTTLLPDDICFFCDDRLIAEAQPQANHVCLRFQRMTGRMFTIRMKKKKGLSVSVYALQLLLKEEAEPVEVLQEEKEQIPLQKAVVKLNLEAWGNAAKAPALHYKLYERKGSSIRDSICIFQGSLSSNEVRAGRESVLPLGHTLVEKGRLYALLLYPDAYAEDIQKGAYYRWVGDGISEMDGSYGYWNGDEVIAGGQTGWGKCYLKLYDDTCIYDESTEQEGLGNRFGIKGMEKLYQNFQIPETAVRLSRFDYLNGSGLSIQKERKLHIKCTKSGGSVLLYFASQKPVTACVEGRNIISQNAKLILPLSEQGWCTVVLKTDQNELMMIKELEDNDDSY